MKRRGIVYIAPADPVPGDGSMVDPATSCFWVSWQDHEGDGLLGDAEVEGAEDAIAWGRERAPMVLIRLGNRGDTYFSAGDVHPLEEESVPPWPPGVPEGGWWEVPSFPTAAEVNAVAEKVQSGELDPQDARQWAEIRLALESRPEVEADRETLLGLYRLAEQ